VVIEPTSSIEHVRDAVTAEGDEGDRAVGPSPPRRLRRPTSTSNFGAGRRESHDATAFYARFHPPVVSGDATLRRPRSVDRLWCHDAADMDPFVEDNSVALVVTSPPYFAGKAYEEALGQGHIPADYQAYRAMLFDVFAQCRHKLEPGGRIAVNVANLGRKPYRSLAADVIDILEQLGFLLRGEVVWRKGHAAGGSCAWGTYQRPGNPVLRDVTERIVLASKGRFERAVPADQRRADGWPHEGSMRADDFVDATTDVWDMAPESATRVGHPAPFPVELPLRLIELFTYRDDLVLDPFVGSGTTAVAAVRSGRHYIGFDVDATYVEIGDALLGDGSRAAGRVVVPTSGPSRRTVAESAQDAVEAGRGVVEVARLLLSEAGFVEIADKVRLREVGLDLSFGAVDAGGRRWLFDVCGAFSATRPGLRRADVAWKAIGKAAVLDRARRPDEPQEGLGRLVLLATDLPSPGSPIGRALGAVTGLDRPIHDVVEVIDVAAALEHLRRIAASELVPPPT